MIDYNNLPHHATSESIVNAIAEKVGTTQKDFFRLHTAYYFSVMASMMRTMIQIPGIKKEPVNVYGINLAPSGFGKGYSTSLLETSVIDQFQEIFLEETFPAMAELSLPQIALRRSDRKQTDYDEELLRVQAEFATYGPLLFSFDSATGPAIKQLRQTLLMANGGSLNLQTDEIGANLSSNTEAVSVFLELYSGTVKQKLIKHTNESKRGEQLFGLTPTNMMLFGVQATLLDGGQNEEMLHRMLSEGYGRRCFFGYVDEDANDTKVLLTPAEQLELAKEGNADTILANVSSDFGALADMVNAHKTLIVDDDTALTYFHYKNDCEIRAREFKMHQQMQRTEMQHRFFKAIKLAGAYAFVDQQDIITKDNLLCAIHLAENSGKAYHKILNRDRTYVMLAKYLGNIGTEVTQADLVEALPFYKGGKSVKDELINQATAWGYKNSIIIKKKFVDAIEFFSGETLEPTDLEAIKLSYSARFTEDYSSGTIAFDELAKLTQTPGLHYTNHHLIDGDKDDGYRKDEFCIPGFNLIAIDVDNGITLSMAKRMMEGYKCLFYTTKSHTEANNRFRILMPTNHILKLDTEDYKLFMNNVFEWLPFDSDTQTGQRSRKWQTYPGSYEYLDGDLFDVLPFIPKTTKNDLLQAQQKELYSMDGLERWVIQNTGSGNRNNQLLRYALILVDGGCSETDIQNAVFTLNNKMSDALDVTEIADTIFKTVKTQIAERDA